MKMSISEFKKLCNNRRFIFHYDTYDDGLPFGRCMNLSQKFDEVVVALMPDIVGFKSESGAISFSGVKYIEYTPVADDGYYSHISIVCDSVDGIEKYTLKLEEKTKINY